MCRGRALLCLQGCSSFIFEVKVHECLVLGIEHPSSLLLGQVAEQTVVVEGPDDTEQSCNYAAFGLHAEPRHGLALYSLFSGL